MVDYVGVSASGQPFIVPAGSSYNPGSGYQVIGQQQSPSAYQGAQVYNPGGAMPESNNPYNPQASPSTTWKILTSGYVNPNAPNSAVQNTQPDASLASSGSSSENNVTSPPAAAPSLLTPLMMLGLGFLAVMVLKK